MKKFFVSVSFKLVSILVGTLLCISVFYSWLSFVKLESEYAKLQQEALEQGRYFFQLQTKQLVAELQTLVEWYADPDQGRANHDFNALGQVFNQQFEKMQLHLDIEDIWLLQRNNVAFSTSPLTNEVRQISQQVQFKQQPISKIVCEDKCFQAVGLPIMNAQGDEAAIILKANMSDNLMSFNELFGGDVAVFRVPHKAGIANAEVLLSTDNTLIDHIKTLKVDNENIDSIMENGLNFTFQERYYLVNFLPLTLNENGFFNLILIEDLTQYTQENQLYRNKFLAAVIAFFLLVSFIVYVLSRSFTDRLVTLADFLPLLAKKQFTEFRKAEFKRKNWFSDELDTVIESATMLSYQLEKLNLKVNLKTNELENIAMYALLTG